MSNSPRTRAWRRAQRQRCIDKRRNRRLGHQIIHKSGHLAKSKDLPKYCCWYKPEKKWRLLYLRSRKLARAKQLKGFYPQQQWNLEIEDVT